MTSSVAPTSLSNPSRAPRNNKEVHELASSYATAGDVAAVRRLARDLEASDTPELAAIAGLYIETAMSYRDNP